MRRSFWSLAFGLWSIAIVACTASADTIYLKDGKELKGIVVEDYRDRLTFSTADGEISLMKSDIRELYFDSDQDNLLALAKQSVDRKSYERAFAYYNKVLKMDPNSKEAKDGIAFLQGYMYRKNELMKEYDVARREEFERYGTVSGAGPADEKSYEESVAKLNKSLGITLSIGDVFPVVQKVVSGSSAAEAGVKAGDRIVAVWGRLTGYIPLKEIVKMMIEKPLIEIKCTIERTVDIPVGRGGFSNSPDSLIGASLAMEFDGLTISGVKGAGPAIEAGLAKGGLVTAINGKPTRYMPLKKAIGMIKDAKGGVISITFRKELTIWRRG